MGCFGKLDGADSGINRSSVGFAAVLVPGKEVEDELASCRFIGLSALVLPFRTGTGIRLFFIGAAVHLTAHAVRRSVETQAPAHVLRCLRCSA
jgi:hypothetical protein